MTEVANKEQYDAWNGWVGTHWAEHPDRYDGLLEAYNTGILDAAEVEAASRVLDVGSGTGQLTRAAGLRAAKGTATGVDISTPMVAVARRRSRDLANVSFVEADAQVHAFPEGGYDAVVSRGGVMFFDDPVAALTNIAAGLRGGGRLAFLAPAPGDPDGDYVRATAAVRRYMTEPSPTTRRMMSFADPDVVLGVLGESGFRDVRVERVDGVAKLGADPAEAASFISGQGMVRSCLERLDDDTRRAAVQGLEEGLAGLQDGGELRVRDHGWLVTAVRG